MSHIAPGDYVVDALALVSGDPASVMVVLDTHDDARADEFAIAGLEGMTVAQAAYDWPPDDPDLLSALDLADYDPDADHVVDVVFAESLDIAFGDSWFGDSPDALARRVEDHTGVGTYSYHAQRLEETEYYSTVTENGP